MAPENLLFWISSLTEVNSADHGLLCRRHADAMVVPLGWTLDDRRSDQPPLFTTRTVAPTAERAPTSPRSRASRPRDPGVGEQLELDGTGEIGRPPAADAETAEEAGSVSESLDADDPATADLDSSYEPWSPDFDSEDDLDGLLGAESPLLARAFRGTGRPRG